MWREGVPVVVRNVRKGYLWDPPTMGRATTEANTRFDKSKDIEVTDPPPCPPRTYLCHCYIGCCRCHFDPHMYAGRFYQELFFAWKSLMLVLEVSFVPFRWTLSRGCHNRRGSHGQSDHM